MKLRKLSIVFVLFLFVAFSCGDNPADTMRTETLVLQIDGELESLGGDCSAVQVRTRNLGQINFSSADKIRFNFSAMSDADLSSISIFYVDNGQNVNLVNLANREEINNNQSVEVASPGTNQEIFLRVTLQSSVCTGHIFYLTFSNLKIYTIQ